MADTKDPGRVRLCAASPGPFEDTMRAYGSEHAWRNALGAAADHGAMLAGAEAVANAQDQRLRDAAPDLLAALRWITDPYGDDPSEWPFGLRSRLLAARAAIAKATAP